MTAGTSPVAGTVVAIAVRDGERVAAGRTLCTVESMKMHHDVVAERPGIVSAVVVTVGAAVVVGDVLVEIDDSDDGTAPGDGENAAGGRSEAAGSRADLAEVVERHRVGLDESRPDAVAAAPPTRPAHRQGEHRRTRRPPGRSSNTDRSSWRPSVAAAASTTSSPTRRQTG